MDKVMLYICFYDRCRDKQEMERVAGTYCK